MAKKKRGPGRPKNNQIKRGVGVYAKNGWLHTVVWGKHEKTEKTMPNHWEETGLRDTPENVEIAKKLREERLAIYLGEGKPVKKEKSEILFLEYVKSFIDYKSLEWEENTTEKNRNSFNRLSPFFDGKMLGEIDKLTLSTFINVYLIEERHLAPSTIKDTRELINQALEEAIDDELIEKNPLKRISINTNKTLEYYKPKKDDDVVFDEKQAVLFLKTAKEYIYERHLEILYYAFYFILFLGLRRSELLGIQWSDIDFEEGTLQIGQVRIKVSAKSSKHRNGTKTPNSTRSFILEEFEIKMLRNIKKQEDDIRRVIGWGMPIKTDRYKDNDYVFKHKDGELFYPDTLSKVFKETIKRNPELPQDITLHGLRKSCASILIARGVDIKSVQDRLGHKDAKVLLDIYAKVKSKAAKEKTSEVMSEILNSFGIEE